MKVESQVSVNDLKVGDVIDLEGDKYADPQKDNTILQYEYLTVECVDFTPNGVLVMTSEVNCLFPHGHLVQKIK